MFVFISHEFISRDFLDILMGLYKVLINYTELHTVDGDQSIYILEKQRVVLTRTQTDVMCMMTAAKKGKKSINNIHLK